MRSESDWHLARNGYSSAAVFSRAFIVLVMAPPPDARLVAPPGCALEPLIHTPEAGQSARISRISVVNDAVCERESAYARALARVRRRIGSAHGCESGSPLTRTFPRPLALVVVFEASFALLLLRELDAEVGVEVAAERRRPRKGPAHSLLVRLQLRERRPRDRPKHDVVVGQVDGDAVEPVRDRGAGRTPRRVVGPEHEMVDEELRTSSEEVSERRFSVVGLEAVILVDSNPRQLLPFSRQLIASPRQFLLGIEHLQPGRKPLFTCSSLMVSHRFLSFSDKLYAIFMRERMNLERELNPRRSSISTRRG